VRSDGKIHQRAAVAPAKEFMPAAFFILFSKEKPTVCGSFALVSKPPAVPRLGSLFLLVLAES